MAIVKKIKYILYVLLGLVGVFFVVGNVLSNYYGYSKEDVFAIPNPARMYLFNDSAIKDIRISSLYASKTEDSIYILNYKDKYQIALWITQQSKNMSFLGKIDTTQKVLYKGKDLTFYLNVNLLKESHIIFESRMFLPSNECFSLFFQDCHNIKIIGNGHNYQCYHLKAGTIFVVNNQNEYYDFTLGQVYDTDLDLMVIIRNDKLYILTLYSLKGGENIESKELLKILNENFYKTGKT